MRPANLDIQTITQLFRYQNKTYEEIAEMMECHPDTVYRFCKKHSIKKCYQDKEWLRDMHHNKRVCIAEMARIAHCDVTTIRNNMKKFGIETDLQVAYDSNRKYSYNQDFFEVIDTEEKAYWLGFILADGNLSTRKDRSENNYRLTIKLAAYDDEHLKKFLTCIEANVPISYTEEKLSYYQAEERVIKFSRTAQIRINSSKMGMDLVKHGVSPKKSLRETPPKDLREDLIRHFIRGYFDGDGCFSESNGKPSIAIVGSEAIISYIIKQMEKHLGFSYPIAKQGKLSKLNFGHKERVIQFMNWLYKGATVYLERKYQKYHRFLLKI